MSLSLTHSNQVFSIITEDPKDSETLLAFKKLAPGHDKDPHDKDPIASARCCVHEIDGVRVGVIERLLDNKAPNSPFSEERIGIFYDLVEESVIRLRSQGAAVFFAPEDVFPESLKKKFAGVGFPNGKDRFTALVDLNNFVATRPHATKLATPVDESDLVSAKLSGRPVIVDVVGIMAQPSSELAQQFMSRMGNSLNGDFAEKT
jgi:hypothetical protein